MDGKYLREIIIGALDIVSKKMEAMNYMERVKGKYGNYDLAIEMNDSTAINYLKLALETVEGVSNKQRSLREKLDGTDISEIPKEYRKIVKEALEKFTLGEESKLEIIIGALDIVSKKMEAMNYMERVKGKYGENYDLAIKMNDLLTIKYLKLALETVGDISKKQGSLREELDGIDNNEIPEKYRRIVEKALEEFTLEKELLKYEEI